MRSSNLSGKLFLAILAVAFLTILFVGCSKTLNSNADSFYVPTVSDATASATLTDLQAGRSIYINSCGNCHNLYPTANVPSSVIPNMTARAGLSVTQTSQVTKYINLRK
jgi:mono/diheme cytochrome c family protein